MKCGRCQHENPPDAAFCDECGARLEATCTSCGEANRAGAKFCRKCGEGLTQPTAASLASPSRFASPESYTPKHLAEKILTSKAALEGERKQVTVLFADLKASCTGAHASENRPASTSPSRRRCTARWT